MGFLSLTEQEESFDVLFPVTEEVTDCFMKFFLSFRFCRGSDMSQESSLL